MKAIVLSGSRTLKYSDYPNGIDTNKEIVTGTLLIDDILDKIKQDSEYNKIISKKIKVLEEFNHGINVRVQVKYIEVK